jgi:hypothetical protein
VGAATRTDTLKLGENTYAYVSGLTDTSNRSSADRGRFRHRFARHIHDE